LEPASISTDRTPPEPEGLEQPSLETAAAPQGPRRRWLPWLAVVGMALPVGAALLVASVARRPAVPPGIVGEPPRLEAEVEAARGTGLLLVLDPEGEALAIRARGVTLDTVPLEGVRVDLHRPAEAAREASPLGLWQVEVEPEGSYRRVIAPSQLRPYEEKQEASEPPARNAPPEVLPDPPSSYTVGLDGGWELFVTQQAPPDGIWPRFRQALAHGWARQWRRAAPRPDRLVLLATPEQGSRLHHLFREGTPLVLAREPLAAVQEVPPTSG
jgi:hypothetical protein